jgi:hypothetical protein
MLVNKPNLTNVCGCVQNGLHRHVSCTRINEQYPDIQYCERENQFKTEI